MDIRIVMLGTFWELIFGGYVKVSESLHTWVIIWVNPILNPNPNINCDTTWISRIFQYLMVNVYTFIEAFS